MNIVFEGSVYSMTNLHELLEAYPEASCLVTFIQNWRNDADDFLFQTSGSTGAPKTVKVGRNQILASVNATTQHLSLNSTHKVLLCLDPNFIAAIMMAARCLVVDMDMVLVRPSANPLKNLKDKIDFVSLVPFQVYQLIEDGDVARLNEIQNILIGGAPLRPAAFDRLSKLISNIYITYGMTETVSHIALMPVKDSYADAHFHVLPEIVIGQNEDGCLQITGEVTNNQLIQTNDIVEIRSKNQFRWLGRKDFIINSGGIKIYPEQLERMISEILDAELNLMISWMKDDKLGAACILLTEGEALSPHDFQKVQAHIEENLSKYYCPKSCIAVDRFERTESGKLLRGQTRLKALGLA